MSRMILNETAYFGAGSITNIVTEVKRRGFKKALLVTDGQLVKMKVVDPVIKLLKESNLPFEIFDQVEPNPSVETVKKGVDAFKKSGADYLIALGGGSPQDACKAVGIIANNPEFSDVLSLEGGADTKKASVPVIAIPTTAGSAAEITINYVITDHHKKRKFVCWDPHAIPSVAIVDSNLMKSMPASLKAATGIDALTHAIEGYITKGAWAMTDMFHLDAIKRIAGSLRASVQGDAKGGEEMALAQYVAGMGFSNVGLGLVHGMAHPLGAFYDTPHGVANAILLPHVMEYNAQYTGDKFREVARAMGVEKVDELPLEEARKAAVNAVSKLCRDVGIPTHLRDVGMEESDIDALSQSALSDVCTPGNPRPVKLEDIKKLYQDTY